MVHPSPRLLLIFPSIAVMLLSMLCSWLAFRYNAGVYAILGMLLAAVWLGIMVLIALPQTDGFLAGNRRLLKRAGLTCMVVLLALGAVEFGAFAAGSKAVDITYNDSSALLYQAAQNLLHGKNPYAGANVVTAMLNLKSPPAKITPLRAGPLARTFPTPSGAQYAEIWQQALASPTLSSPSVESHLGYPAGFFLIPAFFMWLGLDSLRWMLLILTLPAVAIVLLKCRPELRPWLAGAFLSSLVIWASIAMGLTGVLYFPFLLLAWALWCKNMWLSALCMGVAVATKQLAWYFLPFYLILVYRGTGWQRTLKSGALVGVVFAAFNAPFMAGNAGLWLSSVLSEMRDPLFPLGTGVIILVNFGYLKIETSTMFLALEVLALLSGIIWFWFKANKYPAMGIVLSVLPIFFAWRSIWPYFFFVDVILLSTIVINDYTKPENLISPGPAFPVPSKSKQF